MLFRSGEGVPEDDAEAVKWYRKAADQGLTLAQFKLGGMYYNGEGVPENHVRAYAWWNLVSASNSSWGTKAKAAKEVLASGMTPEQIAEAQKLSTEYFAKIQANQ